MSKNRLFKSKFNVNKKIEIEDIDLTNVKIDDLQYSKNNYNKFINLKNLLDSISSCQLSDAYNNLFRKSGVVNGLKSLNNHLVYGQITTCITNCDDWGTGIIATDECHEGDILFIKSSCDKLAIWGELASTNAKNSGVAGVAVYGSVRDVEALKNLDFPIFSCNFTPSAGKAIGIGTINEDITIDDDIIRPGDFFFGDENGVVIIPALLFTQVINEVLSVKLSELEIIGKLDKGISLMDVVGLNKI